MKEIGMKIKKMVKEYYIMKMVIKNMTVNGNMIN